MSDKQVEFETAGDDLLTFDVADEALEAAANATKDAAMSLGTPTVNILVIYCGDNS